MLTFFPFASVISTSPWISYGPFLKHFTTVFSMESSFS
ncbi:hypothetical protein LptCag_1900 [Leptospirillum ferriphilum]|uniref:Uncharacterized protein n=1 Tax=Leptospirillum ferriphilum TaxID=178606 RepID=A0A094W9M0_9BACT|nr:hypothetical protein LptCag_1900 [Leptospirillum ferriphilum]